jgi:hypothetical protein
MKRGVVLLFVGVIAFFAVPGVGHVDPLSQGMKPIIFKADITVAQEVPTPSPSLGVGAGVFVLSADRTQLSYAITFTGTSSEPFAGHFHAAANVGETANVRRTICSPCASGTLITGVWSAMDSQPLTPERVQDLLAGRVYVNLHTMLNPGGEIRGQVNPVSVP